MATIALTIGLAAVAVLLIARGTWGLRRLADISSWPAVDATVIGQGLDEFPYDEGGPSHRPKLAYSYTINGKTYRSSRLGITVDAFDIFSRESQHRHFSFAFLPARAWRFAYHPMILHSRSSRKERPSANAVIL
jgi:hypothetical protein